MGDMMIGSTVLLDYRGKRDHSVLDQLRELLLTKKPGVVGVEVLVDTEKFAKKITVFAGVTRCHAWSEKKEGHWSVFVAPPACVVPNIVWKD